MEISGAAESAGRHHAQRVAGGERRRRGRELVDRHLRVGVAGAEKAHRIDPATPEAEGDFKDNMSACLNVII